MASRRVILLDISNNNKSVHLPRVKEAGIAGFWHKVSEGQTFRDGYWKDRRDAGRALGLRVGGYHFARPNSRRDAINEADHFVDSLGPIGRRDLAPVLDLEVEDDLRGTALTAWARIFNHRVHEQTGVWPLFYSYPDFIRRMGATRVIGRGLWLASFGRNDGKEHPYEVPRPFKRALAHQFTSNARIAGANGHVDLSSARSLRPLLARPYLGL